MTDNRWHGIGARATTNADRKKALEAKKQQEKEEEEQE